MKKTLLSVAFATIGLVAFAQKPAAGDFTLESQFSLNMGGANGWTTPEIRLRYFLNEGMAARVRLSINSMSQTDKINNGAIPPAAVETGEIKTSSFGFGIGLGIEKHLAGTDKLSPYFGAELGFNMQGASNKTATGTSNGSTWTNKDDKFETSGGGSTTFGLKLMFGADYYFTDAIYLGGEMGWGFNTVSNAEQKQKVTVAGTTTESTAVAESSAFNLGMMNFPAAGVRFGVKF